MAASEIFDKYKQQWADMDVRFKIAIGAIIVGGAVLAVVRGKEHDELVKQAEDAKVARAIDNARPHDDPLRMSALPESRRNQGLEELAADLEKTRADAKHSEDKAAEASDLVHKMNDRLAALESKKSNTAVESSSTLNDSLPPVDFAAPAPAGNKTGEHRAQTGADFSLAAPGTELTQTEPAPILRPSQKMHIWGNEVDATEQEQKSTEILPSVSIPVNSAIESVMLTGINARSNASGGAAIGTVLSANNVGAPFVARIKGSAILPNGWKVADLGDCFIGGNGIAILSSERANVISNQISCINPKGVIYEGQVHAYGVDLDGIQGISGRVVTKQGAILAKNFAAGIASGLGTALSPTALPGYNSSQQSGSTQGIQYPNPSLVAQSAIGTGFSSAAGQLSKFYLDYAKEMFPVIEVDAGTRITWIVQETIELTARTGMSTLKP